MSGRWLDSSLRQAILWTIALKIFALIVVFDFTVGTLHPFDLPKTAVSRALGWLLAGLVVVAFVGYGRRVIPLTRLHLAVLAFLAANAAAALVASDPYVAAFGDQERRLGVSFVVDMCGLYLAVAVAFRSERDAFPLLVGFAAGTAASIGYGVVQLMHFDPIAWTLGTAKPFSTLGNPNMYGQFLSVVFGVGLGTWLAPDLRTRWPLLALGGLLVIASFALAAAVATRGTVLGILASLGVAPLVYVRLHRAGAREALVSAGASTAGGMLLGALAWGTPLGARIKATIEGFQIEDRLSLWNSGIHAFSERPLLGWAPDAFRIAYPNYRPVDGTRIWGLNYTQDSAHDWLLQAMVTTGIIGTLALVLLTAAFVWVLWTRVTRVAPVLSSVLLVGTVAWWTNGLVTVGMIGVDWWPWVAFGCTAGVAGRVDANVAARPFPRLALAGVGAASLVLAPLSYFSLDADHWAYRATQRHDADAVEFAQRAVDRDPGRALYWNELGRAMYATRQWERAGDAFATAAWRAPYDATFWLNLGSARAQQTMAGDDSASVKASAIESAQRALAVDPNDPSIQAGAAAIALLLGRAEFALDAGARAVELAPRVAAFEATAASAARAVPDHRRALERLSAIPSMRSSRVLTVVAAEIALAADMLPEARVYALRALELDPQSAEARDLLRRAGG